MGVDEISPVAQDYLKVIWSATEWGGPPITTKGLALRHGTTPANVSETLRRLAAQGLVEYEPYRPVRLTAGGEGHAIAMVRRHRLLETFLVQVLGYPWDEVHDEAERIEHAVTDQFIARIDAHLGHPETDPHGDPIPGPDGARPGYPETVGLSDAVPGSYRVVRVSDADPERLARLGAAGLRPGVALTVVDGQLDVAGVRVGLSPGDAAFVLVRPVR